MPKCTGVNVRSIYNEFLKICIYIDITSLYHKLHQDVKNFSYYIHLSCHLRKSFDIFQDELFYFIQLYFIWVYKDILLYFKKNAKTFNHHLPHSLPYLLEVNNNSSVHLAVMVKPLIKPYAYRWDMHL